VTTDLGPGDAEIPYLDVAPADGGTAVTLLVEKPDQSTAPVAMTGGDLVPIDGTSPTQYSQRWTATSPVVYDQPGHWVLHFEVTGTGEGTEDLDKYVVASPTAGGPTWTPGLSRVAAHIPRLTVDTSSPGQAVELGTFTSTTNPTDTIAWQHVDEAVAEVVAVCGTVPDSLTVLARSVAALRAAASIQRAYGNTALGLDTLAIAAALDVRADADLTRLQTAIRDLDDGSADGFDVVYPVWAFDAPDLRFSSSDYF